MIMFFTLNIMAYYSYFYHSVFPGIPELALINLLPYFYIIGLSMAYDLYITVKKEIRIKNMENHGESDEKINIRGRIDIICPNCLTKNMKNSEICKNCGKNLKETIFFSKGVSDMSDLGITRSLMEYKNNLFLGKDLVILINILFIKWKT